MIARIAKGFNCLCPLLISSFPYTLLWHFRKPIFAWPRNDLVEETFLYFRQIWFLSETQNCYVLISKKALLFWAAEFSIPLLLSRNEAAWDPQSWTVTNAQMLGPAPWCCWGPHTHILICLLLLEQGNNKCDKPSGLTYIWRNHLPNE